MPSREIQVQIEGSSGNQYFVAFSRDGNSLTTSCTCPAGEKKTHCKHRLELFDGDISRVRGPSQPDLGQQISAMLTGTVLESALKALTSAQADAKEAADNLKRVKRDLDRVMHK